MKHKLRIIVLRVSMLSKDTDIKLLIENQRKL